MMGSVVHSEIPCADMPEKIVRFLLHDLEDGDRQAVEHHLKTCTRCSLKAAALEVTLAGLSV
jgi:anti-sigma factor RsiW